jgi:hypothetical protein
MGSPHGAPPPDPAPVVPEPAPEPVPEPAPEPVPEVEEEDVPVARSAALIEEALNATLAPKPAPPAEDEA